MSPGEQTREFYRKQGAEQARNIIKAAILDRVQDLKSCGKDDDCDQVAELIKSYIPEWVGEE